MENVFKRYNAKWIMEENCENHDYAPLLKKCFNLNGDFKEVIMYVTGLGLFEATVNEKMVSDIYFAPGESNYGKLIYYEKFDITNLVKSGENEVSILLGNGQYTSFKMTQTMEENGELKRAHRYQKNDGGVFQRNIYGEKKAICVIICDGECVVTSDKAWSAAKSAITFNSWYGGEDFDATVTPVFDRMLKEQEIGDEKFTERFFNPVREAERFTTEKWQKTERGYIVDFGKNGAGVPAIKLFTTPEMRGTKIKMLPCEEVDENGFADQRSSTQSLCEKNSCEICDTYTVAGIGEEEWHPRFCYHGFRYIEVLNMPYEPKEDTFTYIRLMADNEKTGYFETDNEILQKINDMTERSIESNMFFSFTDCPQIEKLGWMETSHLMFKSLAYCRDVKTWMEKIALDMETSVKREENGDGEPMGYMPAIVPEFQRIRGLSRDVNWGGACIMMPWYHYEFYRDEKILTYAEKAGEMYLNYLKNFEKGDLLDNYSQMGDWGQINENTPTRLVENCAYYMLLITFAKIKRALGKNGDIYDEKAKKVKKAFHKDEICYNRETGEYGNRSQASYGCVLFSGIYLEQNEKKAVCGLKNAVERANYHLTSGEVGLRQVFASLSKYGYDDLVYAMVTNSTQPGYGYFVQKNLTTLPEYWNYEEEWWGMVRSRNHAMMGHVKAWLIEGVAGIEYDGECVWVKPYVPEKTTYVKAGFMCDKGKIDIEWRVVGETIEIDASVPKGVMVKRCAPKGCAMVNYVDKHKREL